MGLRGDQIDELRARVPLAYRPWDRPSASVQAPGNEVADVDDAARRLNNTLLNLARGDGDVAERTGYRAPGNSEKLGRFATEEKKRRDSDAKFALDQIKAQIEERNRRIAENLERIAVLERYETALKRQLAILNAGGEIERNEDGSLKDKDAEAAIREYEKRHGVTVDRNDPAVLAAVLRDIQADKARLQRDNADLAAANDRDRQRALDLGADPKSIPATVQRAEKSEPDRRSIDTATASMTSTDLRLAVVDAKDYSAAGEAKAIAAIGGADDFFSDEATATPTGGISAASLVAPTPIEAPDLQGAFALAVAPESTAPMPKDPAPDRAAIKPQMMG